MSDRARGPALLHNMSCRPSATVTHTGSDQCRRVRFAPPGLPAQTNRYLDLCPLFGLAVKPGDDGYRLLLAAASEPHPMLARLPRVAAVLANADGDAVPGLTDDPRLQLHVLSRCAGSVFLRDLPPAIVSDRMNRCVTLLIPHSWSLDQ